MSKKTIIAIVGETGVGKDTVANLLPYPKVCSYTDRRIRADETNGKQHWFVSKIVMDELEKRKDDLIAYTKTGDVRYCALASDMVEDCYIYIINPDGIRWFKKNVSADVELITIGLYLPLDIRMARCSYRSDFNDKFMERVKVEEADFLRFRQTGEFDYILRNDDSLITAGIIKDILKRRGIGVETINCEFVKDSYFVSKEEL